MDNINVKHKQMKLTLSQSQLIEYSLENLLNSDEFQNMPQQAHNDMKILLNKFFDNNKK